MGTAIGRVDAPPLELVSSFAVNANSRKWNVAVIGLGGVAEAHLNAYAGLDCVQLIGVAEPRADRRSEIAERYRVAGFARAEELLANCRPEIVCILTPAATHRSLTEFCAAHRVHVLCEKPMAIDLPDAIAMAEACHKAGVQFFYGSSYRFLPAIREAKRLIHEGALGDVRLIVEHALGGRGPQAYRPLSAQHYPWGGPGGGGWGLVDHGIHMLDVFPWLCDSSIKSVLGRGDRSGAPARPEYALMQIASGAFGVLLYDDSSWATDLPWEGLFSAAPGWVPGRGWVGETGLWDNRPGCIQVFGNRGALRIFHYANRLFANLDGQLAEQTLSAATTPWHFGAQLRQFCENLTRSEPAATTAEDGIRALEALLAVYASEKSGSWVALGQISA